MKGLVLGVVPIKRGGTNMQVAVEQKELFLKKVKELCPDCVRLVDMEGTLENGILWSYDQLASAEAMI